MRKNRLYRFRIALLLFSSILLMQAFNLGTVYAQEQRKIDPQREQEILAILREFDRAPDQHQWIQDNAERLSLEMVDDVSEYYFLGIQNQNFHLAETASSFEFLAYKHFGKRYEMLDSYINLNNTRFNRVSDLPSYELIHDASLNIIAAAHDIDANDLAFRAAVLAADCAYFTSQLKQITRSQKENWQMNATRDLLEATKLAENYKNKNEIWFQRYISLMAAIVNSVESIDIFNDSAGEIPNILIATTAIIEKSIPVEFQFDNVLVGDMNKTILVAQTMARMSYQYGVASLGSARLQIASERAKNAGDLDLWMDTIFQRYTGDRDAGVPKAQLAKLRQSLRAQAKEFRGNYRSRAGRIWAGYEFDTIYGELLSGQLHSSSSEHVEIFHAVENLKARTLLDNLSEKPVLLPSAAMKQREKQLEQQVFGFESGDPLQGNFLIGEMKLISQQSIGTAFDRGERKRSVDSLEMLYRENQAGFQNVAPLATLQQVQYTLAPGEAILEYFIPYRPTHPAMALWALFITNNDMKVIHLPLDVIQAFGRGMIGKMSIDGRAPTDTSPLGELVISTRSAIQRTDEKTAVSGLYTLHHILIEPLAQYGIPPQNFRHWIIIPHGPLHYVPFHALLSGEGKYLIESVAVSVAPSASIWYRLNQREKQPLSTFLGFANPQLNMPELPPLAHAENELAEIEQIMSGLQTQVLKNQDASEDMFNQKVSGKSIVHISTHGEFPEDEAVDLHRILLTADKQNDGRLQADEVRQMNLQAARLVVLSICNGGLYKIGPSDEPYGLIPAFIIAGAENVMGTLWPLEDRFARYFMVEFYKHLLDVGPAEAYRRACKSFIADEELIRRWASFALVGPGRNFINLNSKL